MQYLLTRQTEDTVQHPGWCDLDRCAVDPYDPLEGDHHSPPVRVGDLTLDLSWPGTVEGIHLLWLEISRNGGSASDWMTLRQARALHTQLGRMLDAVGSAAQEHDEARIRAVAP
jgi:hypothetical protein